MRFEWDIYMINLDADARQFQMLHFPPDPLWHPWEHVVHLMDRTPAVTLYLEWLPDN